jgi:hypothetical protein
LSSTWETTSPSPPSSATPLSKQHPARHRACSAPFLKVNLQDLADAQTRTAPTPEQALRNLLPGTDLAQATYEPFGPASCGPVWVRVGSGTYIVQANTPGNGYAVEATFDGCADPATPPPPIPTGPEKLVTRQPVCLVDKHPW